MSTERLNSVMTLHVHKDLLDCIGDSTVVKDFVCVMKFERAFLERG